MVSHDRRVLPFTCLLVLFASFAARAEPLLPPVKRASELAKKGEILGLEQKVDDASAAFEEATALYQKLADQTPSDGAGRQSLAACYEKFGDMLVGNNRLDRGLATYQKSLEIRQSLATQDSENAERLHDVIRSLARMGRVSILQHRSASRIRRASA